MGRDPTPLVGVAGTLATFTLAEINSIVGILVGLATLAFVITRWLFLVRSSGGPAALTASFFSLFSRQPAPPSENSRRDPPPPAEL